MNGLNQIRFASIAGSPLKLPQCPLAEISAAEILRITALPKACQLLEFDRLSTVIRKQADEARAQVEDAIVRARQVIEDQPEN